MTGPYDQDLDYGRYRPENYRRAYAIAATIAVGMTIAEVVMFAAAAAQLNWWALPLAALIVAGQTMLITRPK